MDGINSQSFSLTSNEPIESLEEISIRYPDSLYQSDSLKEVEEDHEEGMLRK